MWEREKETWYRLMFGTGGRCTDMEMFYIEPSHSNPHSPRLQTLTTYPTKKQNLDCCACAYCNIYNRSSSFSQIYNWLLFGCHDYGLQSTQWCILSQAKTARWEIENDIEGYFQLFTDYRGDPIALWDSLGPKIGLYEPFTFREIPGATMNNLPWFLKCSVTLLSVGG